MYYRAVILVQGAEVAEGTGSDRHAALSDAREQMSEMDRQMAYSLGQEVEYHREHGDL